MKALRICRAMRVVGVILVTVCGAWAEEAAGVVWDTRLPAFRAEAPDDAVPQLLYFSAPWCGYCRKMDDTTLREPAVVEAIAGHKAYKVDYDSQGGLVARFGIRGIPAFVLVTERGDLVDKLVGATDAGSFVGWLKSGRGKLAEKLRTDARATQDVRRAWMLTRSDDPELRDIGIMRLMSAATRGNDAHRKQAEGLLDVELASKPELCVPGLTSEDLAIRLKAANSLANVTGGRWLFNPWAEKSLREEKARAIATGLGLKPAAGESISDAELIEAMEVGAKLQVRFVEIRDPVPGPASPVVLPADGSVLSDAEVAGLLRVLGGVHSATISDVNSAKLMLGDMQPFTFVVKDGQADRTNSAVSITVGGVEQEFTTRNVGCELQLTLLGGGVNQARLKARMEQIRFEGFVEYGGTTVDIAGGQTVTVPSGFFQPVFTKSTRDERLRIGVGDTLVFRMEGNSMPESSAVPAFDGGLSKVIRPEAVPVRTSFLILIGLEP